MNLSISNYLSKITMKKITMLIMLLWMSISVMAQEQINDAVDMKIYNEVEEMPSFYGGKDSLLVYLANNVRYPIDAAMQGIQGRVVVSFIVEPDGSLSKIRIKESVSPSINAEAKRIVKGMPRWIPGKKDGKPVRVRFSVPITFRMQR